MDRNVTHSKTASVLKRSLIKSTKGEILFHEGVVNINDLPKHNDEVKGHVIVASHHEMEIEEMSKRHMRARYTWIKSLNRYRI